MTLRDKKNPALWADGHPRSQGNAFDYENWRLECDWGVLNTSAKLREAQAARVDRERANGQTFTIVGMSQKSDERARQTRQDWHGGEKKAPHGGQYSRAIPKEA